MARGGGVFSAIVLVYFFLFSGAHGAVVPEKAARPAYGGVVDFAKVLSTEERRSLEVATGRIARHSDMDVFVATVDDRALHWSWRYQTNRAMVERAFSDVKEAAERHFGAPKELTLLVAFKHQPVLYLKTDQADLARTLLFENFYAGAKGGYVRVRDPRSDTYHDAAMRYLEGFARTIAGQGAPAQGDDIKHWLLERYALLESRDMLEQPLLDSMSQGFHEAVLWALKAFELPGPVALLAVFFAFHFTCTMLVGIVPSLILSGSVVARLVKFAMGLFNKVLTVPLLLIMFAITSADLENIVYLAQSADARGLSDGTKLDIVTYLDWSEAIQGYLPELSEVWLAAGVAPIALIVLGSIVLSLVREFKKYGHDRHGQPLQIRLQAFIVMALGVLENFFENFIRVVVFVFSLVIFPGVLQVYFIIVEFIVGGIDLYLVRSRLRSDEEERRALEKARKSIDFKGRKPPRSAVSNRARVA